VKLAARAALSSFSGATSVPTLSPRPFSSKSLDGLEIDHGA